MPATACTCHAHIETSDGLGRWVVDLPDPFCPAHTAQDTARIIRPATHER